MELNAKDIIHAMKCCYTDEDNCLNCPYMNDYDSCVGLSKNALALIKQLTVENERLRAENNTYANGVEKIAINYYNKGKADTVRAMQEGLHGRFGDDANRVFSNYNIHRYIDQIAKEMLEGKQ